MFGRLNAGVYAVVALVLAVVILGSPRAQVHSAPLESDYPAGAVAYLTANAATLPALLHLFHEYGWGGYLIAHHIPVFVDGRADPYGNLLDDYVAAANGTHWEPVFAAHGVNGVLVRTGAPLDKIIGATAGWSPVYHDNLSVLYIKQ
jgi:hypothetical protein